MTSWTPTVSDLNWCRSLLAIIKDGGIWASDIGAYRVDFDNQRLTLEIRSPFFDSDDHQRNVVAFKAIGWTVTE
jgi:hypothetical protein